MMFLTNASLYFSPHSTRFIEFKKFFICTVAQTKPVRKVGHDKTKSGKVRNLT